MITGKKLLIIFSALFVMAVAVLSLSLKKVSEGEQGCPCFDLETFNGAFNPNETIAYFEGNQVTPLLSALPIPPEETVLGEESGSEKWIDIDLSEQKIRAYEGNRLFLESLVSSGKPWTPTIKGEFRVASKFRYAKMEGGEKGTHSYYYLPNVPYIMFFQGDYSLHGTYWHNNFGHEMSHGCVNLPTLVAEKLFYWTTPAIGTQMSVRAAPSNPGTKIVIHD